MKSTFRPSPAAQRLVDAMLDSALADAELDELAGLLSADPLLRAWYCEYVSLHGLIDAELKAAPGKSAQPTSPSDVNSQTSILGFLSDVLARVPGGEFVVGGLVLLAVTGAVWGVMHFARGSRQAADQRMLALGFERSAGLGIGSLATDDRARWAKETSPPADGTVRIGDRYELLCGRVEVALARGTRVVIDGPATWLLESEQRLRFDSGRLAARVPKSAIGFTVGTPLAEVVDLGTEFGVEVDGSGKTEIHVLKGEVEVKQVRNRSTSTGPTSTGPKRGAGTTIVVAGQAVRVVAAGATPVQIPVDRGAFAGALLQAATPPAPPSDGSVAQIWLGNLFDDKPHTLLAEAMRTDTYGAEPDFNDLGVSRVVYGGSPLVEIAPDIQFDFTSVGWQEDAVFKVANDGMKHAPSTVQGLRLTGNGDGVRNAKIEDGIGMHANSLLTFSLPEIRTAWKREGQSLEFICDAAGVNDGVAKTNGGRGASAHLIVIVSSRTKPLTVIVDGVAAKLGLRDGQPFVRSAVGAPLTGGGRTFQVDQTLGPDAEYLTLVCTSAGDGVHVDHGAWIGARLEVAR